MTTASSRPISCAHADDGTPPPPDATKLHDWTRHSSGDPVRAFVGTVREAAGFTTRVEGVQRANGTTRRHVAIGTSEARPDRLSGLVVLEAEAVRQLASMLRDAANEVERFRSMSDLPGSVRA